MNMFGNLNPGGETITLTNVNDNFQRKAGSNRAAA